MLLAAIVIGALGIGGVAYAVKRAGPRINITSSSVVAGNLLQINGVGFTPMGEATIHIGGMESTVGVGQLGTFSVRVTVSELAGLGTQLVVATDNATMRQSNTVFVGITGSVRIFV